MSTNYEHNGEDETQAARRTAHALGQTEGAEREAVEAEMAASPQARQEVEASAAMAARLKEAAQLTPPAVQSPDLRAAVEARLTELESAAPPAVRAPVPQWRRRVTTWVLTAGCLAGVAVALMRQTHFFGQGGPRQVATSTAASNAVAPGKEWSDAAEKRISGEFKPPSSVQLDSYALQLPAASGTASSTYSLRMTYDPSCFDPKPSGSYDSLMRVDVGGQPLPAPSYMHVDTQYFPPRPEPSITESLAFHDRRIADLPLEVDANETQTGRLMFGVGVNSDAGLVGNVTVDEQNFKGANVNQGSKPFSGSQQPSGYTPWMNSYAAPGDGGTVSNYHPGGQIGATVTLNGGILQSGVNNVSDGAFALNSSAASTTFSGAIGGQPAQLVTKSGEGYLFLGARNDVTASTTLPTGTTTQTVIAADVAPGFNFNDASNPLGNSGLGTDMSMDQDGRTRQQMLQRIVDAEQPLLVPGAKKSPTYDRVRAELEATKTLVIPEDTISNVAGKPSESKAESVDEIARGIGREVDYYGKGRARMGLAGDLKTGMASALKSGSGALTLTDAQHKPAPKKPLETWKPARVVPNASRLMVGEKEELPLKGMQVDVRVDGFRARVLLDLYYFNDRPQQLEGNFQLRLPDEAAPYFFAFGRTVYQAPQVAASDSMFFKPQQVSLGDTTPEKILALRGNSWEQPKVARMVPKEKAAMAYRDTVRRRIDPALIEWSGAGVFQCRVFPLAPQSLHRITIGYDVDLVRVGDDLELRLDLPEWQSSAGAPATVVDLNVAASDSRQVSLDAVGQIANLPNDRQVGNLPHADGRVSYRLVDPKQRPLTVRLRKPGTLMLTGNDEATGNYFATRVMLPLPESRSEGSGKALTPGASPKGRGELAGRPKQAVFLVDTSLSAGPQFPLWTKMLRATLTNNRDQIKQFAVLFFNVETFWWQEKYVDNTPENVEAVLNYADNLALEGATDLGRALTEAAAPKWRKADDAAAPDLFLLSDGAATWGEDRWALLAATLTGRSKTTQTALTPGPSPKGRGESIALFAYRTGLAGGDSRLLGYLAERTGGAIFSLVGEAEIASASVAHRNRPWKLTNIEVAGGHDVLVAGRPQYVFPGQQLTVVGRLEANRSDRSDPSNQPVLTFTLQQGKATQTVKVAMDQVIPSELAGRTFGQVATNQLEDVSGVEQSAEPVATSYARHFRITGRTCSLLMLESEQDYARFNIKPEEDDFVVKERPADPIVSKAIADTVAAMSDPKTNFLAWYNRLAASEVRFELPASLKVFIDGLPEETFAVFPQPLVCKMRQRNDRPENLGRPWQTGMADYDAVDAEAQRRLAAYGADDALRCLSSLVEERPGDAVVARDLAFTAIDWQRPGEAYHLLRRASNARTFEPITFHAMAHCLEQMGRTDLAIIYYELACGGQWDQRFGDMHNIALLDYARFLRRVVQGDGTGKGDSPVFAGAKTGTVPYAQSRLNSLSAMNLRDTADVAALIFWNTDGTDVDLHVVEPSGEECFYQHTQTASGGHISRDVTTGYGPELYLLPKAPSGRYEISAHYFATDANRASTRTKVLAFIYENWGAKDERLVIKSLALNGQKEKHELGVVKR